MKNKFSKFVIFFSIYLIPFFGAAQESVTLSISPTLFDMTAEPGQEWQSKIRVVNVNKFDLTVYVEVVNFAPQGEGGDGRFIPVVEGEKDGSTLAEWIDIQREAITVPREQTSEIPFTVRIPQDASPGGHFAAVLVGTKPTNTEPGQSRLQTAQMVTSLFFARVAGEVEEVGSIREFTTIGSYLNKPEVTFSLRFENKGNVHLKPQGEIKILNMWGEERGIVPINQYSNFGNVLPNSIRKFNFTWKGEWSISDIGRYRAIATLGYGTEEKQFSSAETSFWVIPFKLLFSILIGLVLFFGVITWLVRLYVRHMLQMAGIAIEDYQTVKMKTNQTNRSSISLRAPVKAGILDLKSQLKSTVSIKERLQTLLLFIVRYKLFFFGAALTLIFITIIGLYIINANTKHRAYEVVYENNEVKTSVTSEEILYNQLKAQEPVPEITAVDEALPIISVVNRSGEPGVGAATKLRLESLGYKVTKLEADFSSVQSKTVILYPEDQVAEALKLSSILGNALVSVGGEDDSQLLVYLGSEAIDK